MDCYSFTYVPKVLVDVLFSCVYYEQMDSRLVFMEEQDTHVYDEETENLVPNFYYDYQRLPEHMKEDWESGIRMVLEADLCYGNTFPHGHMFDLLCCDMLWDETTSSDFFREILKEEVLTEVVNGEKSLLLFFPNNKYHEKRIYYNENHAISDYSLLLKRITPCSMVTYKRAPVIMIRHAHYSMSKNYVFNGPTCKFVILEYNAVTIIHGYDLATNINNKFGKRCRMEKLD